MFQTMALVKSGADRDPEKPWHQDNAYFKYAPLEKVVGFWMALDDAAKENGCMHVLPGWHRRGGLKHFHAGDCQIMPDRLAMGSAVPVELAAGGAMFFSGMLPHQTPPNRSTKTRRGAAVPLSRDQHAVGSTRRNMIASSPSRMARRHPARRPDNAGFIQFREYSVTYGGSCKPVV